MDVILGAPGARGPRTAANEQKVSSHCTISMGEYADQLQTKRVDKGMTYAMQRSLCRKTSTRV